MDPRNDDLSNIKYRPSDAIHLAVDDRRPTGPHFSRYLNKRIAFGRLCTVGYHAVRIRITTRNYLNPRRQATMKQ